MQEQDTNQAAEHATGACPAGGGTWTLSADFVLQVLLEGFCVGAVGLNE